MMRPVGKHFSSVTQKAYARHGHAWGELLSNWANIVGAEIASYCEPEKVSWPTATNNQSGASRFQKIGGILTLRVALGRALDVQYTTPQIIDKINAYYGYNSIAQIKIIQGRLDTQARTKKQPLPPLRPEVEQQLESHTIQIEDQGLKDAIYRLAKGVYSQNK